MLISRLERKVSAHFSLRAYYLWSICTKNTFPNKETLSDLKLKSWRHASRNENFISYDSINDSNDRSCDLSSRKLLRCSFSETIFQRNRVSCARWASSYIHSSLLELCPEPTPNFFLSCAKISTYFDCCLETTTRPFRHFPPHRH